MLLGCGCLLAMAAAFAPRLVLLFMWIVGDRVNAAFDTWLWPLFGLMLLPYTTIMYVLVWSPVTSVPRGAGAGSGSAWAWCSTS